jgi:hypothetical protein
MPLPAAVVVEARVFAERFLMFSSGSSNARRLLVALPRPSTEVFVASDLTYDILDEIVEDGAWSLPLDPSSSAMLFDGVASFVAELSRNGLQVVARERMLKTAFTMAASTNIALSSCVATAIAAQFGVPVIVASEERKRQLTNSASWIPQLHVLSLDEAVRLI